MPNEPDDFRRLLNEAAMADADTVTVTGILGKTADPDRFVLMLPNGRSETLEVGAVKSARKIGNAIGQALVELQLDAKRTPESLQRPELAPFVAAMPHQADPTAFAALAYGTTRTWYSAYAWSNDQHTIYSVSYPG